MPNGIRAVRWRSAMAAAFAAGILGCAAVSPKITEYTSGAPPSNVEACMSPSSAFEMESVQWARPTAPSGAITPPVWCASVGPPAVSRPLTAYDGPIDELVLVTWNIRVGGGDVLAFVHDLRSGALTGAPVESFVLLLQEAYRSGSEVPRDSAGTLVSRIAAHPPSGERIDVLEAAHRLGLHAFYAPSMPNGASDEAGAHGEDRGNAILSTLSLDGLRAVELPFEVQRRVAVSGQVSGRRPDGATWSLRVASGHLDTRSRWSRFMDSFGAGRARQANALAVALPGEAVALGADLNTWNASFLEGALGVLRTRFPETPSVRGPTFRAGVVGRTLDHLLVRLPPQHEVEARRITHRYGSDHYPVLGVVRFGSERGTGAHGPARIDAEPAPAP